MNAVVDGPPALAGCPSVGISGRCLTNYAAVPETHWQQPGTLTAGRDHWLTITSSGAQPAFYIVGSRVPIDRIVRKYRNGEDPETIQSHYPALNLNQVDGAITF